MLQDQELLLQDLPSLYNCHSQPHPHPQPPHSQHAQSHHHFREQVVTTYHFQIDQVQASICEKKEVFYINWSDQNNHRYFTGEEEDSGLQQKQNGIIFNNNLVISTQHGLYEVSSLSKKIGHEKSLYYEGLVCKLQKALKKIKENIQKIDIIQQINELTNSNKMMDNKQQFELNLSKNYRLINSYKSINSPQATNKLARMNKNRIISKMTESTKINSNNTSYQFMPKMKSSTRSQSLDHNGYKQNMFASKMATEHCRFRDSHLRTQDQECEEAKNHAVMSKKEKIQKYMAKDIIAEQIYDKKKKTLQWAVQIALWQEKKHKKIQQKLQNDEIKLKEFTFTPEINLKSRMIMKKKGTITPIYYRNDKDNKEKRCQKAQSQRFPKPKN